MSRCSSVGTAMVTASTSPTSVGAVGQRRAAGRRGDLGRALRQLVDDRRQRHALERRENPRVMPAQVADADDAPIASSGPSTSGRPSSCSPGAAGRQSRSPLRWPTRRRGRRRARASARRRPTARRRRRPASPESWRCRSPARRSACPASASPPSRCARPARRDDPARPITSSVPSIASTATTALCLTAIVWPMSSAAMASAIR